MKEQIPNKDILKKEKKNSEGELNAEKLYSTITQALADASEYFLEDIPKSKEEIIRIVHDISEDYDIDESIPPNIIDKLYPLFLEDWDRERKDHAGFERDEDWPNPSEWPEDIEIEDPYPDFEEWKKPKVKKASSISKEQYEKLPMPLHDFLKLLKQEIVTELSKIDDVGLTDEDKRYLGIKKSIRTGVNAIQISRGINLGSEPYTAPEIEIDEKYFSEKNDGLQNLEQFLNGELQFTHFDDNFWDRASGLDKELYEKIKKVYTKPSFCPIDLPNIQENWLKIKEYENKKREEIEERSKKYINKYETARLRKEMDRERYARNVEELRKKILEEKK